jgi:hypothetical protein
MLSLCANIGAFFLLSRITIRAEEIIPVRKKISMVTSSSLCGSGRRGLYSKHFGVASKTDKLIPVLPVIILADPNVSAKLNKESNPE